MKARTPTGGKWTTSVSPAALWFKTHQYGTSVCGRPGSRTGPRTFDRPEAMAQAHALPCESGPGPAGLSLHLPAPSATGGIPVAASE
ncbi:hypothetical protein CRV15_02115 [Streptomyces clavuligerus]|uniref:Uncharacterized protein n=1 Tax=Streptomyces clavuligerus TaxID=1901 RepID=B5GVK9_STRCL|nr:hypothetical protein D1794_02680 [Streptomyces clavuligerus]EDY50355.1 hypothetical protein SSCG_03502 [Streptomyces clavuligerus]EFG10359.1 Hypothetical protein SCLAV_5286 [Streptomyces clavuligerus]QCS04499.1 hypothetical protein CRV15_02115 [Streptomyces clavuligerus]QPJ96120.1 hypothetical protein GE265_25755 [Streptomyces clavuligerus]